MERLRGVFTLTLVLLCVGSGASPPSSHAEVVGSAQVLQSALIDDEPSEASLEAIQSQVAKLTAADGVPTDRFGGSVSISGDIAVAGARQADVGGNTNQGAAYVFSRDQGGADMWGQVAKLTATDGAPDDSFGWSVAVGGDIAVVGAPYAKVGSYYFQGAAYVYYRNQGGPDAWGQVAKLTASDGTPIDYFGWSVSLSGDTAIVGALADVGGNASQGAAYVYYRNLGGADVWGQAAKLTAADGAATDQFGWSLSLSDDTALVGAQQADVGGRADQGAVYAFYRDQGGADAWGQVAKLTAADGGVGDTFGASVSVDDDTAVVGAPLEDIGSIYDQGAAYIFYRDQGGVDAWGQVTKLLAGDGATLDHFGSSVTLSGYVAVVGASGAAALQGAAYIFDQGGTTAWGQVDKLTPADGAAGDAFGTSVSLDGDTALAGAPYSDPGGMLDQGAAYVYTFPSLHLSRLRLSWGRGLIPGSYKVRASAAVHDQAHAPAAQVTVYGDWTLPNGRVQHKQATTNAYGLAPFLLSNRQTGTYQFCITDMAKPGYAYDPGANDVPSCKSVIVGP